MAGLESKDLNGNRGSQELDRKLDRLEAHEATLRSMSAEEVITCAEKIIPDSLVEARQASKEWDERVSDRAKLKRADVEALGAELKEALLKVVQDSPLLDTGSPARIQIATETAANQLAQSLLEKHPGASTSEWSSSDLPEEVARGTAYGAVRDQFVSSRVEFDKYLLDTLGDALYVSQQVGVPEENLRFDFRKGGEALDMLVLDRVEGTDTGQKKLVDIVRKQLNLF